MSSFRPQWSFFWWDSFRFKLQQLDSNKMHAIRSEPKMPLRRLSTSDAEEASLPLHTPKSSHSQSCVLIVYRMKSWTRVAWFLKCIFPSRVTPPQAKPSGQGIFSSDWYWLRQTLSTLGTKLLNFELLKFLNPRFSRDLLSIPKIVR